MKKIIYTGRSVDLDYWGHFRFVSFMRDLGAEEVLANFNNWVYSFQGVNILRRDLGVSYSSVESMSSCTLELVGEREKVGEVEKILLSEQEHFRFKKGDEENTKNSVLGR